MRVIKNVLASKCKNENCIVKNSRFKCGSDCVEGEKKMNGFRARQDIFFENNSVEGIYFILSGVVKVYKNLNGNNQIVRLSTHGDVLGHRGIGKDNYPVSAQAITDTELCFFPKKHFLKLLEESSSLATNLMLFFANELNIEETKLSELANYTVLEKGEKALNILVDSFGLASDNSINHSELLTRQEIGELVGLTANQTTKVLKELQDEKIIRLNGKKIIVENLDRF